MLGRLRRSALRYALPRRDGFSVVAELRRAGRQVPVLMLIARDDVASRVRGLELKADDVLVKPFHFVELVARMRAILRRTPDRVPESYRVAGLFVDPRSRRVERAGRRVEPTPREFALLLCLVERASEVVPRAVIADRVWDMNFDSDTNVIDVHVRRLRAKVDAPGEPPLIHTVRGVGYVLESRQDG